MSVDRCWFCAGDLAGLEHEVRRFRPLEGVRAELVIHVCPNVPVGRAMVAPVVDDRERVVVVRGIEAAARLQAAYEATAAEVVRVGVELVLRRLERHGLHPTQSGLGPERVIAGGVDLAQRDRRVPRFPT